VVLGLGAAEQRGRVSDQEPKGANCKFAVVKLLLVQMVFENLFSVCARAQAQARQEGFCYG
jgi:hypothetical protein